MTLFFASLYLLTIAFQFGSAIYVLSRSPFARINQAYALLAIALLGWVATLFVFDSTPPGISLLWIGRANFAAAALVTPAIFGFTQALLARKTPGWKWMSAETFIVAVLSLTTGLVDKSETIVAGVHITTYGTLFLLYVIHLLIYLLPALYRTLIPSVELPHEKRTIARLVGTGFLISGVIGITTLVVIPYMYGNFHLIDVGTLATIAILVAIAYAACVYHLFNIRVVIRAALVFGVMIAFVLELYSIAVDALTKLLPAGDPTARHIAAASVAIVINAFTQAPLKEWLEKLASRLLKRSNSHDVRNLHRPI